MNEDSPFAAFVPSSPETPAAEKASNKKGRKARKKKTEAKPADTVLAPAAPKKTRKPRAEKSLADIKVPLASVQHLGALNADSAKVCLSMYRDLSRLPKKARKHIINALVSMLA